MLSFKSKLRETFSYIGYVPLGEVGFISLFACLFILFLETLAVLFNYRFQLLYVAAAI